MDQIGDAINMRPYEGLHIEVEWEPLVLAHVSLTLDPPPSSTRADEAMEVEAVAPRFANDNEDECIVEERRLGGSAGQPCLSPTFDIATSTIKPPDSAVATSEST